VATTRRVQRAKTLVDETALSMSAIAFASGFASIRRFNAAFRRVYRRPPSVLRRSWRSRPGHLR
jgi:AraC family transcriptional regulator of adaptative response / DNA-3-methyladenine glycosylase II